MAVAIACAWTTLQMDFDGSRRLTSTAAGRDFAVSGWVDGFPSGPQGQVSFTLHVVRERSDALVPGRIRLTWYDPPIAIRPSMALDLTVRLRPPRGFANPGGFDYERWLFVERIGASGYVRSGDVAATSEWTLARRWLAFRAAIAARLSALATTPDARALLIALAIGERSDFERDQWQVLRATGTSHLVAISGLHIGIIAGWLFFLARRVWLRMPLPLAVFDLEVASLVSLAGAATYAAIAGFSVPTQRALIMLSVALTLVIMRRSATSSTGIAIALVLVTTLDPLAVVSGAFWLSFGAVVVLSLLARQRSASSRFAALRERAMEAVRTQWGITIGLAPVIAFAFGEISLVAPFVNMVAIPVFALFLVPLVLVATLCIAVGASGLWLVPFASECIDGAYRVLAWMADAGPDPVAVPGFGPVPLLLMAAGVAIALPTHRLPGRFLGWLAIAAALVHVPQKPAVGTLRAVVLDVGHGLAVIVRTAEHTLLYDTGARYRSGFDTGRDVVLPVLRWLGIERLDRIVVSHADNDHSGGLESILDAHPTAELLAGRNVEPGRAHDCVAGARWAWDGIRFEVLHPPTGATLSDNDGSCVMRVDTASGSLLLTGDIEARAENAVLGSGADVAAAIVVIPHHGSATSSSDEFVRSVGARVAIASAAFDNRWGFPRTAVTERWRRSGAEVITTGVDGAVDILMGVDGVDVRAARWRWQRPWMAESASAANGAIRVVGR